VENSAETIESYITRFPPDLGKLLKNVQFTIRKAAPEAVETIKYGMPTYLLNGNLIFFAGYPTYISVYPRTAAMEKVKEKIARYESGRGTLKFPIDEPIPYGLIGELVTIRVAESRAEAEAKENAEKAKPAKATAAVAKGKALKAKPAKAPAKAIAIAAKAKAAKAKPAKAKPAKAKPAKVKAAKPAKAVKKATAKKTAAKKSAGKKTAGKKAGRKKASARAKNNTRR
jgi:uncharacterized protein YdhG (YjbR/CyaY superfamily)